ncbi:hypothetical protein BD779DRAFT_705752 [Infundibulicybe gibba]|nr:hypothetical protein BD779DRAFT_705752 [Infundibulicybe gibba]
MGLDIELPQAFTIASILTFSVLVPLWFTFLSTVTPPKVHTTPFGYLAQWHRRREMYLERVHRRALASRRRVFPFCGLPYEVQLVVLSHCAGWLPTNISPLLVSKWVNTMTIEACLPFLAVRLVSSNQVTSFSHLLAARSNLEHLVRHLWVTPVDEASIAVCRHILKSCTGIRSVACNGDMLRDSILDSDRLRHLHCTNATILGGRGGDMESIANSAIGVAFFRRLTHLRVVGRAIPRNIAYVRLTHLSYELDRRAMEQSKGFAWGALENRSVFPCLQSVLLTRVRYCSDPAADPDDWKRPEKVIMLYIPREESEMQKWCEGVNGYGIWEQAKSKLEGMMIRRGRPGVIV